MLRRALVGLLVGWSALVGAQTVGPLRFLEVGGAPRVPLGGDQHQPSGAAVGGGAFVAWTDRRASTGWADLYGAFVDGSGQWSPSTGFPISTAVLGQTRPAVCCSDQQCLVAWSSNLAGVQVRRYGLDLQPLDLLPRNISGGIETGALRCVAGASEFLVVWARPWNGVIQGVRVATDGTPGPVLQLNANAAFNTDPEVAWNGLEYRLAWRASSVGLVTVSLSSAGALGAEAAYGTSLSFSPRLVAEGLDWAATWVEQSAQYAYSGPLQGLRITAAGALGATQTLGTGAASLYLGLARSEGATLLAWHRAGGDFTSYVAPWWPDGGLGAPVRVRPAIDDQSADLALVARDGGALVLAVERPLRTDLELAAVALDALGQPVAAAGSLGLMPDWNLSPTLAAGPDGGFDVAWLGPATRADAGPVEIRVAHLAADGTPVAGPTLAVAGEYRTGAPLLVDGLDAPALVWPRKAAASDPEERLTFARLDPDSRPVAPVRLDGAGCCLTSIHDVPMGPATWVLFVEYETGLSLRGVRVARDGTLLDAPGRVLAPARGTDYAGAFAPATGTLLIASATDPSVGVQRFAADGSPLDAQERLLGLGSYPRRPAVASSGTDFLLAWMDIDDVVKVVPIDGATGTASGPAVQLTTRLSASVARVRVVFDGREYLVVFDAETADGGADVLLARFSAAGELQGVTPFVTGPGEQHGFVLATSGEGRLGAAGLLLEPDAGVLRTAVVVRAAVPLGGACVASDECLAGPCVEGFCCEADAGPCATQFDGGAGPGPGGYRVGCGCSSGVDGAWLGVLALAFRRRSRARPRPRGTSAKHGAAARPTTGAHVFDVALGGPPR